VRALTVQQPWAWAIVHGGKDVENRTQAWGYRGPLAIHAGLALDSAAFNSPLIRPADAVDEVRVRVLDHGRTLRFWYPVDDGAGGWLKRGAQTSMGAVIGVVDLVDVHVAAGLEDDVWSWCCRPWGEGPGVTLKADGKFTGPRTHLVLENPRPLATPIPARGRLGLWTPDDELLAAIREQVSA
jgi:hypothetical protein